MNNKKLFKWSWIGIIVILSLAALWHFVYAWIPGGVSAAIFPVNESVWEHVKLFFFPAIIFYTIQYFVIGRKYKNFIFSHGIMLLLMPALTLGLFYFYRNALGIAESLLIDIFITFLVIALGSMTAYRMTISKIRLNKLNYAVLVLTLVLFTSYAILTFFPPEKPIFYDKNIDAYGITDGDHDHDDDGKGNERQNNDGGGDNGGSNGGSNIGGNGGN